MRLTAFGELGKADWRLRSAETSRIARFHSAQALCRGGAASSRMAATITRHVRHHRQIHPEWSLHRLSISSRTQVRMMTSRMAWLSGDISRTSPFHRVTLMICILRPRLGVHASAGMGDRPGPVEGDAERSCHREVLSIRKIEWLGTAPCGGLAMHRPGPKRRHSHLPALPTGSFPRVNRASVCDPIQLAYRICCTVSPS